MLASHSRSSGSIPGNIHVGQGRFAAVISHKFLLFLPANHQCTIAETLDSSDQSVFISEVALVRLQSEKANFYLFTVHLVMLSVAQIIWGLVNNEYQRLWPNLSIYFEEMMKNTNQCQYSQSPGRYLNLRPTNTHKAEVAPTQLISEFSQKLWQTYTINNIISQNKTYAVGHSSSENEQ